MDTISTDVALHASTSERESHNIIKSNSADVTRILLHNITQRQHLQQLDRVIGCFCERLAVELQGDQFTDGFLLTNESFITRFILVRLRSANDVAPKRQPELYLELSVYVTEWLNSHQTPDHD